MKVSALYITKNEEENIRKSIESIKDFVNQIVLVDTGSNDNTVEIAKEYGAEIYYYKWDNNFSNPRNYAIEKAKNEWIIFLDADEYFDESTKGNIRGIIEKCHGFNEVDGIMSLRVNINKDNTIRATDYMLRIFRKSDNIRYRGRIHENVHNNGEKMRAYIAKEDELRIYHTGYSNELIKEKFERNLVLLNQDVSDGKAVPMTFFYLADCYMCLKEYNQALENLDKFLDTKYTTLGFNTKPYQLKIIAYMKLNYPFEQIKKLIEEAIDKFPHFPEFYRLLAVLYFNNGYFSKALETYLKTIQLQKDYNDVETNPVFGMMNDIYSNIAKIYMYKNENIKAIDYLVQSLKIQKNTEEPFRQLLKIIKHEKTEDIVYFINSIYDINEKRDVEFLVRNLSELKMSQVLMYYCNIWHNKYNEEDSSLIVNLLCNGKAKEAFKYFKELYLNKWEHFYAFNMVLSALLSKDHNIIKEALEILKPSFSRLIKLIACNVDIKLISQDEADYLQLMDQLIKMNRMEEVEKLLSFKIEFKENISEKVGDLFFLNDFYDAAIEQYNEAVKDRIVSNESVYCKIAICNYRMLKYRESVEYFYQALKGGHRNPEVADYLKWIKENCKDNRVINNIDNIIKEYSL